MLAYRSEADRAYGLAGMTISLASLEALGDVASVSLDAPGPMVAFSTAFFYGSSQSASPKALWQRLLRNYQVASSLVVGNVLARCLVQPSGTPGVQADPTDMLDEAYKGIEADGRDICQLEDDEVRAFYSDTLMRQRRLFANTRLHQPLRTLVDILRERRTLSGREIAEELHYLRIL